MSTSAEPPKMPGNSFIQFSNETRPKLSAENPDMPLVEITKRIGELWRDLPLEEKNRYAEISNRLKEEYKTELQDFEASLSSVELDDIKQEKMQKRKQKAKRKHKSLLKKFEKPKQPRPAFTYYVVSRAGETSNFDKNRMSELAADYNELTEEDKQIYKQKAEYDKIRYLEEVEEWEDKMVEEGHPELIRRGSMNRLMKKTEEVD